MCAGQAERSSPPDKGLLLQEPTTQGLSEVRVIIAGAAPASQAHAKATPARARYLIHAAHGVARWRLVDLAQILFEDHGVSVAEQTLNRVLRSMGYRKLSARPRHHAQDPDAIPAFKKPSRLAWRRSRRLSEASR